MCNQGFLILFTRNVLYVNGYGEDSDPIYKCSLSNVYLRKEAFKISASRCLLLIVFFQENYLVICNDFGGILQQIALKKYQPSDCHLSVDRSKKI